MNDVKTIVKKLKYVFGLNELQIANLINIPRPTLYRHISSEVCIELIPAYQRYLNLALLVESNIDGDVKSGLKSVLVNGMTLLSYLKKPDIEQDEFVEFCRIVAAKVSSRIVCKPTTYIDKLTSARDYTVQGS